MTPHKVQVALDLLFGLEARQADLPGLAVVLLVPEDQDVGHFDAVLRQPGDHLVKVAVDEAARRSSQLIEIGVGIVHLAAGTLHAHPD